MQIKKVVYLFASTILGIILSFLLHAIIELVYLREADDASIIWTSLWGKGSCALPIWLQIGLLVIGMIGGYALGRLWWRIVYIEKRHWRVGKKKQ